MRLLKRLLKWGVFFVLLYMFVYDCAQLSRLFGESFLSWAAYQGTRLLDIPGTRLFVWRHGQGQIYNVSPNLLMSYKIGCATLVFFIVGLVFGFFAGPLRRLVSPSSEPILTPESETSPKQTSGLAIASLVLALVGGPALGFVLGFFAVIFGEIALCQIAGRPDLKGKSLAILGQIIGTIDVVVWTLALAIQIL